MLRLFLIWRLLQLARRLIAITLMLMLIAVTLLGHAIASSGRHPHNHTDNPIRGLQHPAAWLRNSLARTLAARLKPAAGR